MNKDKELEKAKTGPQKTGEEPAELSQEEQENIAGGVGLSTWP